MLKPHDLRHGVAMEVYEQHHDLEEVCRARSSIPGERSTPTTYALRASRRISGKCVPAPVPRSTTRLAPSQGRA
jgi:hypothetical protein